MRILMLTQFYPPIIGGEEQQVRTLSVELAARGHHVAVVTLWHEGMAELEMDEGVRVYRIRGLTQRLPFLFSKGGRRFAPPMPDPEIMGRLRRILASEQPDIVHAHNWLAHSFLPLKAWSRAPLVVSLHNYNLSCATVTLMNAGAPCSGPALGKCLSCAAKHYGAAKGTPTVLGNWVMSAAERRATDLFLPVSQAVAAGNGLVKSGLPYQVIPNFIPDEMGLRRENADEYAAQLPEGDFILFVGAMGRFKGVDVLLRAHAALPSTPPLVLIGYRADDFALPSAADLGNVRVLENWPRHAVMEAWRRCSIAVAPSVWPEPFALVVTEAMTCGKPVIASRIGGLSDLVVDGETGYLTPPGDAEELSQALKRLIDDPELRERMGDAGLQRVELFRASAVLPRYEQAYADVVARSRRQGA